MSRFENADKKETLARRQEFLFYAKE